MSTMATPKSVGGDWVPTPWVDPDLLRIETALAELAEVDRRRHRDPEIKDRISRCLVELDELVGLLGGPSPVQPPETDR